MELAYETAVGYRIDRSLLNVPHLLVVEDDEAFALGLEQLMGPTYEIRTAGSAREAVELFASDRPDVMIVDYQLPDSNGIRLLESIRRRHGEPPPAVMLSAYGTRKSASFEAGYTAFLQKPCPLVDLIWTVERAIARERE